MSDNPDTPWPMLQRAPVGDSSLRSSVKPRLHPLRFNPQTLQATAEDAEVFAEYAEEIENRLLLNFPKDVVAE